MYLFAILQANDLEAVNVINTKLTVEDIVIYSRYMYTVVIESNTYFFFLGSAALDGMWATLVNESSPEQLQSYFETSPKVQNKVMPCLSKAQVKKYEESDENMCRSLKILYAKGLLSKEKYKSVCVNIRSLKFGPSGQSIVNPKLVYYDKLIAFIKSVDIENICDFPTEFCKCLETLDEPVCGSYRELCSYVLVLAAMYIVVDQKLGSESFFKHFGELPYHFRIAIGADGAPFGKDDEATAWLVSFLNVGQHVQSQNDNFLICGANCSESHISMKRYANKLVHDISYLEKQLYTINGFKVKFTVDLLPCDMKWLSSVAGELNNAAYYFSPFGNVNSDNKVVTNGSLGEDNSCTWHPWNYDQRVRIAKKVAQKRDELSKTKYSAVTKRNKLLGFIREHGSRQEHEPLLGKLIDCAFAEPLHNSNNAWQYLHTIILEIVLAKAKVPPSCTDINSLPDNSPFIVYLRILKDTLKVTRLVKKLTRWFREGRKNSFAYRFTGKETKKFCHKFMFVIQCLSDANNSPGTKLRLAALAFCCVQLRDAISYFSRVEINQSEVEKCQQACQYFYNICALLLKEVTPTIWTIGYAIPRHVKLLFGRYGMGLGLNSMQGREAKHVKLSQFAKHSTKSIRWCMVLRHDYISNVWIRKQDPGYSLYTKYEERYIPKQIGLETFCYCGYPLDQHTNECSICSSAIYKAVVKTAVCGSLENITQYIELNK